MGNGAFFGRKKKIPPPPRDPIRRCQELLANPPAKERVISALKLIPPGLPNRYDKILIMVNRRDEPTEENPDPLRIELDFSELKVVLKKLYDDVKYISSDGLGLCRSYVPKIYDEHTVERAQSLSKIERDKRFLMDQSYAYGEIDFEIFATMYMKVISVYGVKENGCFFDLGCGVGSLVRKFPFFL
jgi:hypothetical protein